MVWPKAIHRGLEIVSERFSPQKYLLQLYLPCMRWFWDSIATKTFNRSEQVRHPQDIHSPIWEGEKMREKGAEDKALLNDKLLNQPNMKLSPFNWTGTHKFRVNRQSLTRQVTNSWESLHFHRCKMTFPWDQPSWPRKSHRCGFQK